jgi:hypothetical protein
LHLSTAFHIHKRKGVTFLSDNELWRHHKMKCPECQFDNREEAKFCKKCGAKLNLICPQCSTLLTPDSLFCDECGHNVSEPKEAPPKDASGPPDAMLTAAKSNIQATALAAEAQAQDAERRQLTVMFCDLVGSTNLSARLDLEDLREVVRLYQKTAADVIQDFDGHIAQYLGDGLLVYFGYPQAHEDDAHRAVHAALGIVEAMGTLNTRLDSEYGVQLAVRLGIHTGPVVVGKWAVEGGMNNWLWGKRPTLRLALKVSLSLTRW